MELLLLVGAMVLFLCVFGSKISGRFGVPVLLCFLLLGMLFGSDGLLKISFDNYALAKDICGIALVFIMFSGGFGTNWRSARPVAAQAIALSSLGVLLTAGVTALFCHFVLRMTVLESFLTGSVIASTDAASVFAILRAKKLNLKEHTASLLEVESGSNDPMSYMLTMIALSLMSGETNGWSFVRMIGVQLFLGALIGVVVALGAVWVMRRLDLTHNGMNAVFVVAVALLAFALPASVGGNGYLSVYIAGIFLGNRRIPQKVELVRFFDAITALAQIVLFFLLGLLAFPSQIPAILPIAVAIVLFVTFVARPVAVWAVLGPMKSSVRQIMLVSFAGLRGAASIVFAIMATVHEAYVKNDLFHIVFCIALFSVAVQGTLLPFVARKLKMVDDSVDVMKTFNDYREESDVQLLQSVVTSTHPWNNRAIGTLDLPSDTLIVMIKRGTEALVPSGDTVLQDGDAVILSGAAYQDDAAIRLREVRIEEENDWTGKPLREVASDRHILVILVKKPDGTQVIPNGETCICVGDTVIFNAEKC